MSEAAAPRGRLGELLARLAHEVTALQGTDDSEQAIERLATMDELAREVQAEIDRLRREGDARG